MRPLSLGLVAVMLGANFATSALAAGVIQEPNWQMRPSGEDVSRHYPKAPLELSIEGRATMSCEVTNLGVLRNCAVVYEAPANLGFGAAVLSMATLFRMRPMTVDGAAMGGAVVRIPVRFTLPRREEPALPKARTPEDLALGRQAAKSYDFVAVIDRNLERKIREIEFIPIAGTPDETRAAAATALRDASKARLPEFREAYAHALAAVYTRTELEQIAAFFASPAGRIIRNDEAQAALFEMLDRDFWRRFRAEAHAEFCKAHSCDVTDEVTKLPGTGAEAVTIDQPVWAEAASSAHRARATPSVAADLNLGGSVRMNCGVTGEGLLERCRPSAETPKGLGFGSAAVSLAGRFRLSPISLPQSAQGETVAVRVQFGALRQPEPFTGLPAPSKHALALGEEVVRAGRIADGAYRAIDQRMAWLADTRPADADPSIWTAALAAIRAGAVRATEANLVNQANAYAAQFPEPDLVAAIAFLKNDGGRAIKAKATQMQEARKAITIHYFGVVASDAGAAYCKAQGCEPAPVRPARDLQPDGLRPEASTRSP